MKVALCMRCSTGWLVLRRAAASPGRAEGILCPPSALQRRPRGTGPMAWRRSAQATRARALPVVLVAALHPRRAPPQGGLIFWADLVGAPRIVARLRHFASLVGPRHAGFFAPCDYLVAAAEAGRKLGAGPAAPAKL